ncbi:unnamed protein product [Orchesella dallaii]|uniref:DDB1-and CUL4-associated factor 5 n=1 Tax=Orchesella dallaii TaxID=48710 RepID=A0ABP1QXW9_9HEXA
MNVANYDSPLKMDFNPRGAPGHPLKYLLHRSTFDHGPYYRNIVDWQFEKTKTLHRKNLVAHFGCVNAIEFSKDGNLLVSGGDDRRILLWKVDKAIVSKDEPKIMQAEHLSNVFSLDFSCSSAKIISAGNDDQVIVHDISTGAPLDYFVHEQPVYGVSADPVNESIFCSACDDGRVLIFDIRDSGNDPFCLAKVPSAFHSAMFHPIEPRLVVTANSKEGVASWDVRMPKKVFIKYGMQNSNQCCMSARFNRLGSQILVLRRRLPPILYATDSPGHLYQFNHRGYYNSCTMKSCSFAGQNDQYVLSGSDNFDLHLWKIPTPGSDQWVNKADKVLRGHRSIVNQVRYNYVHNVIASSGVEKIVKLWSPFPMSDEPGGKFPSVVTNEFERRIYTPDDYVSLVMQTGQGHFMSLTYEAGRKNTKEDSRMLAFFDALVQRDINGLSDEDSDNFPETSSYTNTVYSSPETSSSENEDEDSNPPNYRTHLPAISVQAAFSRISREVIRSNINNESVIPDETSSDQASTTGEDASLLNNHDADTHAAVEEQSDSSDPSPGAVEPEDNGVELNQQTENRDMTANMITQLILEKESRRKQVSKPNVTSKDDNINSDVSDPNSESVATSSDEDDSVKLNSTSRPLKIHQGRKIIHVGKKMKPPSGRYSKTHKKFRKRLLRVRKQKLMSTPVYESSRNVLETTPAAETSFARISELMTRNQSVQSDSSGDSSTSTSTDSSSSDEWENESVMKDTKKKSRALISSDSSSSDSQSQNVSDPDTVETEIITDPSTSHATPKDLKRKRRSSCKFNGACKALFKRYVDSEPENQRDNEDAAVIPRKRAHLDNLENSSTNCSTEPSNTEHVIFKRLAKNKSRNYRKASAIASTTPPDSGIDVSKEPEPCCSKSFNTKTISTSLNSAMSTPPKKNCAKRTKKKKKGDSADHSTDPGIERVVSDDESE